MNKIEFLRQLIGQSSATPASESLSFSSLSEGVPLGALSEISGIGKTEFTVRFLAEHKDLQAAWLEEDFNLFPGAFYQRQVNLNQLLFIETGQQLFWALQQVVCSQLFKIVVAPQKFKNLKDLRKLQLHCEAHNCSLVLLADQASSAWPIALRVQVHKDLVLQQKKRRRAL